MLQRAELCSLELMRGPPVAALHLCRCRLLSHGDEGCFIKALQDEVCGLRGDSALQLDCLRVLEVDSRQA